MRVNTFLHEFGHGLHGIFANTHYESVGTEQAFIVTFGTSIANNGELLVEKGFLEHFCQTLSNWRDNSRHFGATHYIDSSNFNVAYACLRQVSFSLLDMGWYTRTTPLPAM